VTEKAQIRATVIGTLIVAAILWLLGLLKPVFAWILHGMTAGVTLPVWLLVILALGIALSFRIRSKRVSRSPSTVPAVPEAASATELPLTDLEMSVFRILTQADGGLVGIDDLESRLGVKRLLLAHALEGLWNRGYLEDNYNHMVGRRFYLSSRGTHAAIQAGLVE
jgi:hypothetical protein